MYNVLIYYMVRLHNLTSNNTGKTCVCDYCINNEGCCPDMTTDWLLVLRLVYYITNMRSVQRFPSWDMFSMFVKLMPADPSCPLTSTYCTTKSFSHLNMIHLLSVQPSLLEIWYSSFDPYWLQMSFELRQSQKAPFAKCGTPHYLIMMM